MALIENDDRPKYNRIARDQADAEKADAQKREAASKFDAEQSPDDKIVVDRVAAAKASADQAAAQQEITDTKTKSDQEAADKAAAEKAEADKKAAAEKAEADKQAADQARQDMEDAMAKAAAFATYVAEMCSPDAARADLRETVMLEKALFRAEAAELDPSMNPEVLFKLNPNGNAALALASTGPAGAQTVAQNNATVVAALAPARMQLPAEQAALPDGPTVIAATRIPAQVTVGLS